MRILIVDDNRDLADSLGMFLRQLGGDCRIAYTGEEAVELARDFSPRLCLIDINMPVVSGFELVDQLRRLSFPARPALIAVTGLEMDIKHEEMVEAGFDDYFRKPVEPEKLARLVLSTLAARVH